MFVINKKKEEREYIHKRILFMYMYNSKQVKMLCFV